MAGDNDDLNERADEFLGNPAERSYRRAIEGKLQLEVLREIQDVRREVSDLKLKVERQSNATEKLEGWMTGSIPLQGGKRIPGIFEIVASLQEDRLSARKEVRAFAVGIGVLIAGNLILDAAHWFFHL